MHHAATNKTMFHLVGSRLYAPIISNDDATNLCRTNKKTLDAVVKSRASLPFHAETAVKGC